MKKQKLSWLFAALMISGLAGNAAAQTQDAKWLDMPSEEDTFLTNTSIKELRDCKGKNIKISAPNATSYMSVGELQAEGLVGVYGLATDAEFSCHMPNGDIVTATPNGVFMTKKFSPKNES